MKNVFMMLAACVMTLTACAKNEPIDVNRLPDAAQQVLKTYFSDSKVALAKVDYDGTRKSYEVMFTDGSKIEFDSKGEWKEIERVAGVPEGLVPQQISNHVKTTYPDQKIVKIDRDRHDYEVKLDNHLELKFNMNFELIEIGD